MEEETDPDWFGYECKSGQILFYYNKTTGEHRWPCSSKYNKNETIIKCEPVESNKIHRGDVSTQTESHYSCNNRCTSMYVDTFNLTRQPEENSCTMIDCGQLDPDWVGYECKSGQILFYYNKRTGEHRWACSSEKESNPPIEAGEVDSKGTQTDDNGCCNGCTSMYIKNMSTPEEIPAHGDPCEEEVDEGMKNDKTKGNDNEVESSNKALNQDNGHDIRELEDTEIKSRNNKNITDEEMTAHGDECERDVDEGFICMLCDLSVKTSDEYYNHLKTHCCGKSCECPVCQKVFKKVNYLFNHLQSHSQEKLCRVNQMGNESPNLEGRTYTCTYCNKRFLQQGHLETHEHIHAGIRPYTCNHCNKAFTRQITLKKHKGIHNSVESNKCSKCNKTFTKQSYLKRHERVHTGVKPYTCTYCNKRFTHQGSLKKHERIHTGVKPYTCTYCNKGFTQQSDLKKHERIHTGVKPYTCTYCNKGFTQQGYLKIHKRIHSGVKPYTCTYCNKGFAVKCNLKNHERIHTGVKPYTCTYCNKGFTVKCNLKKHERIHTGVKPYTCTYCNKGFTRKGNLERHERIHTGVKPYICTYCNTGFAQQGRLKEHERIHTGFKPYNCTYCNKGFTQQRNLEYHERIHTGVKPYMFIL